MGLSNSTRFDGEGFPSSHRKRKSSTNDNRATHPYLTRAFWEQKRNQFWHHVPGKYSPESIEYLENNINV